MDKDHHGSIIVAFLGPLKEISNNQAIYVSSYSILAWLVREKTKTILNTVKLNKRHKEEKLYT